MGSIMIGSGGFAREIFSYMEEVYSVLAGTICDNFKLFEGVITDDDIKDFWGIPKICNIFDYVPDGKNKLVCMIGDPAFRKKLYEHFKPLGAEFESFEYCDSFVAPRVKMGEGCIVNPYVVVTSNAIIGNLVSLNVSSSVGHDSIIGDYCNLASLSVMGGFSELGEGSYMGLHAVLLPHVKVGKNCMIGAGAVVTKNVPEGTIVKGVPAK